MKTRLFIVFILISSTFSGFGQTRTEKDLIGKWTAIENEGFGIKFIKNQYLCFYSAGTQLSQVPYKIGFSKKPISMEIRIPRRNGDLYLKTELNFIDDNNLQFKIYPGSVPIPFPGNTDASGAVNFTLKRDEPLAADAFTIIAKTESDLIGNWQFNLSPKSGLSFSADHTGFIYRDAERSPFTYTSQFTNGSATIDLVSNEGGRLVKVKMDVVFLNNDVIKWHVKDNELKLKTVPATKNGDLTAVLTRVVN